MTETNDGFCIAEEDMRLRGPGDIDGTQQSGLPINLKVAHLIKDVAIMEQARIFAKEVLSKDPQKQLPEHAAMWNRLRQINKKEKFSSIS